jgi:hypothetical protein
MNCLTYHDIDRLSIVHLSGFGYISTHHVTHYTSSHLPLHRTRVVNSGYTAQNTSRRFTL